MEASEFLCIVGPSGCGKSTLLNVIAGFLVPTAGEIRIGGKAGSGHGPDRGGVFPDFPPPFPCRPPLGSVSFGLARNGRSETPPPRTPLPRPTPVTRAKFCLA